MKSSIRALTTLFTAVVALAVTAPALPAGFEPSLEPCRRAIAKSAAGFVQTKMKAIQRCRNVNLGTLGSCPAANLSATIARLEMKLRDSLARKCATLAAHPFGLRFLNFPGRCPDVDPADRFTVADLQNCIVNSHEEVVDDLIAIEYSTIALLDREHLACQAAVAKHAQKYTIATLKAVQKCREAILHDNLPIPGGQCPNADPAAIQAIGRAESRARTGIASKCSAAELQELGLCGNPGCVQLCGPCDIICAADCIIATHRDAVDELISAEYPDPPKPPRCGDDAVDAPTEECDGTNDGACPGNCGAPEDNFPCLCLDNRRARVVEHADADLDLGWRGRVHDLGVVEGGGYFVDLYDCDGPAGPDTECTVGPSCSDAPHQACSNDADCAAAAQGTCRKKGTAVGPHCALDVQQTCSANAQCTGSGNSCVQTFHGPPLPLSGGGIAVCVLNVFTEDVVGTMDLATGSSAVRLRHRSVTHFTTASQPCPVCGGFCAAPAGDLGGRHMCATNADCADVQSGVCVTSPVCSFGPNVDKACRPDPPFGGSTWSFGNPSVDCPPDSGADISSGGVDIVLDPATTGSVSLLPSIQCNDPAFSGKRCAGGTNNGADCVDGSECPGGTCSFQCFCPNGGVIPQQPNGCDPACVRGPNDAAPCSDDTHCPGGFCHPADCRPDLMAPAHLQPYEGSCTTTSSGPKDCFLNSGITRVGVPDPNNPVLASVFCIPSTGTIAVDATAGRPGPGTLRQPTTVVLTGF